MRMRSWMVLCVAVVVLVLNACEQPDPEYTLKVTLVPQEGGSVEPATGVFKKNTLVNVVATPVNGWKFVRWEGDASGEISVLNLTMTKDVNLVAVFEKRTYPLNINITGKGLVQEEVLSAKTYPYLTLVRLTAVADQGWKFAQWSGDLTGTTNPTQLSINQEKTVGVTFERQNYTVSTQTTGKGTVTILPFSAPSYPFETALTVRATPDKGWAFEQWSGDVKGTSNPAPFVVDANKLITAVFKGLPPTVILQEVGEITTVSARVFVEVSDQGAFAVTERGVCYATSPLTTVSGQCSKVGSGVGSFEVLISNLQPTSTYYVRAYASTEQGTTYSEQSSFTTTALLPSVTTTAATQITSRTARVGGTITDSGSDVIIDRGICYAVTPFPDLRNSCISTAGDLGAFSVNLSNLETGTNYYMRAYAKNRFGTAYGNQLAFITLYYEPGAGVSDIDGNRYPTIKIGTQEWMAENLKVKRFRNGEPVPYAKNSDEWNTLGDEVGYCQIFDQPSNEQTYGILYKWKVTTDARGICPTGWRVPSDSDWETLIQRLGGNSVAGGLMKRTGTTYWLAPNSGATNASGFSAVSSGNRRPGFNNNMVFWYFRTIGEEATWWSTTLVSPLHAWYYQIGYASSVISRQREIYIDNGTISFGLSIRCVK